MEKNKEILYLTKADVQQVGLPMKEYIDMLEQAFFAKGSGQVDMPPKGEISSRPGDFLHAMPCYVGGSQDKSGLKWIGGYFGNPDIGLPYLTGLIVLNDSETGVPIAIMDCIEITGMRTAAVSGLAFRKLANPDVKTAAIIGCGLQGRTNLDALLCECPQVESIVAWGPNAPTVERYCGEMSEKFGRDIRPVQTVREAVEGIDVLAIAGPGVRGDKVRVIEKEWIKPGATIATVNNDAQFKRGVLAAVAHKVFVDDIEMYHFMKRGTMFDGIDVPPPEIGDLLTGKAMGREQHDEIIVSMPVGIGMDDVVCASRVMQMALNKGIGRILPL